MLMLYVTIMDINHRICNVKIIALLYLWINVKKINRKFREPGYILICVRFYARNITSRESRLYLYRIFINLKKTTRVCMKVNS